MFNDNQESSSRMLREFKLENYKQKLIGIWESHRKLITYSLLVAVLTGVLWGIFCWYSGVQSEKYSAILHQVIIDEQKGDTDKAMEKLKLIYETRGLPAGVKGVGSLKYASMLLASGKDQEAITAYLTINENGRFDSFVREYAGLIALKTLVAENKKGDQDKISTLITSLKNNSKTLKYYIVEQEGVFKWLNGDLKNADKIFQDLSVNPEVSDMLKKRAVEMHNIYVSKFGMDEKSPGAKSATKKDTTKDAKKAY